MIDRVIILDWSAASAPKTGKDSIWAARADARGCTAQNIPTRAAAKDWLAAQIYQATQDQARLLIGVDFSLAAPQAVTRALTGQGDAFALWDWLATRIQDDAQNRHNLRDVAAAANRALGDGPFWGNGAARDVPDLPRRKPASHWPEWRACETHARALGLRPKPIFQLAGAGAVGAQSLLGMAHMQTLRRDTDLRVWPFQDISDAPCILAEVYPSLLDNDVAAQLARDKTSVKDKVQVTLLAQALYNLAAQDQLAPLLAEAAQPDARAEGWILGLLHQTALRGALPAQVQPPRLRDDCFAMPQGVDWMPVDKVLAALRGALHPVVAQQDLPLDQAAGRVLAAPAVARRANPPRPNAAVDGYGFAHAATGSGVQRLPLVAGRAAAGQPFAGAVPPGAAVRILTGAILPEGVDTVVLEEDCAIDDAAVVFDGPVKLRANTRRAGEDMNAGDQALPAGHRLRAPDLALLSALGVGRVTAFAPLCVGVLSTGDEIVPTPDKPALPHQIYDANRPMLLDMLRKWGHKAVDLGHVRDRADQIARRFDRAATQVDAIITSGGASAGDEDHVSRLLRQRGNLTAWRIALKPGRPLALAMWQGVPVFGLPGNPVAAFVCAAIFARPALSQMAGSGWLDLPAFTVPAAFSKSKKPGRREYLRARLTADGGAEVFTSEGSGRISGLSWATGLVELPDAAATITPGCPVRFIPYAMLGL